MDVTTFPKPRKPIQDKDWLNHVRMQPCLFCGQRPAGQAHHVRWGHKAGMGTKPDDLRCIPLCPKCHGDVHNAKIPAHIGREEILECVLDLVTNEATRCRELIENANAYLAGGGCGAVSVQSAARLFDEMECKRTESHSNAR